MTRLMTLLLALGLATSLAAAPAHLVKDVSAPSYVGADYPFPLGQFTASGDTVWFVAPHAYEGGTVSARIDCGLYRTDGTTSGTVLARDLLTGGASGLCPLDGSLYYLVQKANYTFELWRADGMTTGTTLVRAGLNYSLDNPNDHLPSLFPCGDKLYFPAINSASGRELWISDGTSSGTRQLMDINPGKPDSLPTGFLAVGNRLFFTADDGVHGRELWTTDGTSSGTHLVKDINPGSNAASLSSLFALDDHTILFTATDGVSGGELWRSDGTAAGTSLVADINPGSASSAPSGLVRVGDWFLFTADDGTHGRELWRSDGTAAGTFIVRDIKPGSATSGPGSLVRAGGWTWFTADDGVHGKELWRSDGTADGTVLVCDINPGDGASSDPTLYATAFLGNELLFSANDGVHGRELWASDGTAAGSRLVQDINPGGNDGIGSDPSPLFTAYKNNLFFFANDGRHGYELWRTDGTADGTVLVRDIYAGAYSSVPGNTSVYGRSMMRVVGDTLLFIAADGISGFYHLWCSDGTTSGTRQFINYLPYMTQEPINLFAMGSTLYFAGNALSTGKEPWRSDGTASGTCLLKDLTPGPGNTRINWQAMGDRVLIDDGYWQSDGTAAGTIRRESLWGGTLTSISNLIRMGDTYYFTGQDAASGNELWRSDGTASGTTLLYDCLPGPDSGIPTGLTVADNQFFFSTQNWSHELWVSDGTTSGTKPIMQIFQYPNFFIGGNNTIGRNYFFEGYDKDHGFELWVSDGTTSGTSLVADIRPGPYSALAEKPSATLFLGSLYFPADDGVHGTELWRSDGTAAGTILVADLTPGANGTTFGPMAVMGGTLYFFARDASSSVFPWALWRTDGTSAGTERICETATLNQYVSPSLARLGNTLFFLGFDSVHGSELWRSDGTAAGTRLACDLRPGVIGSYPQQLTATADAVYFTADDGHGRALWRSDGTAAGTVFLHVFPIYSHAPYGLMDFTGVDGELYFTRPTDQSRANGLLWRSDGSEAGTAVVGAGVDNIWVPKGKITAMDGSLYFSSYISNTLNGLLEITGPDDARPNQIVPAGQDPISPNILVNLKDRLFMTRFSTNQRLALWMSDGTCRGTHLCSLLPTDVSGVNEPTMVDGILFLRIRQNDQQHIGQADKEYLWRSDGTASGTLSIKAITSRYIDNVSDQCELTACGQRLFFTGDDGVHGTELWISDGTASGTMMVRDIWPGVSSSTLNINYDSKCYPTVLADHILFVADDSQHGRELWTSDGTEAGTFLLRDLCAGATGSDPADLLRIGDVIYFSADDGVHGRELWRSDGTVGGTRLVVDMNPFDKANPQNLTDVCGTLYFTADDGTHGCELWRSDGTAAGTALVQDIAPGPASSMPAQLTFTGTNLYFTADDGTLAGREPWVLPLADVIPLESPRLSRDLGPALDVDLGALAELRVAAGGTPPFTYQWFKDGAPLGDDGRITGTATPHLLFTATSGDTGHYHCQVTNASGQAESTTTALYVRSGNGVNDWILYR